MAGLTKTIRGRAAAHAVLHASDPQLDDRLRRGMAAAEERLRECIAQADDPHVEKLASHLVLSGGKRLRPLLVLLGAQFGRLGAETDPAVVDAAVVVELVHVASLCHDDVMDQAATRRGSPSVNALYGNSSAVLAGNWLLARAGMLAGGLDSAGLRLYARVTEQLVVGQMHEVAGPYGGRDALSHYFAVISGKSASLISASLRIGAVQAGAPDAVALALGAYGEHLGIAFQISDDLLDITSESSASGKEQGKDLAAGVASLPVVLALADRRPKARKLRELLSSGAPVTPREHRRALELLRASDAMGEARTLMQQHLQRARAALADLPAGAAQAMLGGLCEFVAARDR